MNRRIMLFILTLAAVSAQTPGGPADGFLQKPYLQLGDAPKLAALESALAVWHAGDTDADWSATVRSGSEKNWREAKVRLSRTVNVPGTAPHRVYTAELTRLSPGKSFSYRIIRNGKAVFESAGMARRPRGETQTFAVMGDIAQGTPGQKAVAWHLGQAKPDYLVEVGDMVYGRGRVSEYYEKYFPILNCDTPAPENCGAILRSTITLGLPGNHDIATKVDFDSQPDSLAYFLYWMMPLNGPVTAPGGDHLPEMTGSDARRQEFLRLTPAYPRMTMYSVDYGDIHWTMLDSNFYVDWTDPKLREWVRNDIRSAKGAAWRFVGVHHPPFNSSKAHFNDQHIRLLSDIFEEEGVDVVFSGHVHNYQRTHPLRFQVNPQDAVRPMNKGAIGGRFTLDESYDGVSQTRPNGVLWIVTGAGGAGLYDKEQEGDRSSWQPFTSKFVSTVHSFTLATVSPTAMTVRQIDQNAREIDRFTITKAKGSPN